MEDNRGWQGFWGHVQKTDSCWLWIGYRDRNQYGVLRYRGTSWLAHRVSWILYNGRIPEGLFVCHSCDNPPCVNPAHLWLGTNQDNIADSVRKGRTNINGNRGRPRDYHSDRPATGAERFKAWYERQRDKSLDIIFLEDSP